MNVIAEIQRINERELALGVPFAGSWHQKYRESAWVYVGGLPFELSEGDVLCVFSQFGEIEDLNLVRDGKTGKSRGFAFVKFEDQRSTVLAVDNFNGARLLDRVVRVDHVLKYKLPKELQDKEDADSEDEEEQESKPRGLPGHAYEGKELATEFDLTKGHNVFAAPEESRKDRKRRHKAEKKEKKAAKKLRKLEEKQQQLFEDIRKKRQAQRAEEERERQRAGEDGDGDGGAAASAPSATGWRGRMEPNAAPAVRGKDRRGGDRGGGSGQGQQDKSFGGMSRVR